LIISNLNGTAAGAEGVDAYGANPVSFGRPGAFGLPESYAARPSQLKNYDPIKEDVAGESRA